MSFNESFKPLNKCIPTLKLPSFPCCSSSILKLQLVAMAQQQLLRALTPINRFARRCIQESLVTELDLGNEKYNGESNINQRHLSNHGSILISTGPLPRGQWVSYRIFFIIRQLKIQNSETASSWWHPLVFLIIRTF